jgi:low affinity Fe/Cu permease
MAVQVKLSELIIAAEGAQNKLANCEEMPEDELERLHAQYRDYTETLSSERERRAKHNRKRAR